ncbi:uncharacterized protein N7482_009495 [Penicillium canariense]|uniref:Uncharacterized protein n=1 Tax=Penicillium canariense TaxID=189055 RepID=A0A9W9HPC4_9EURO|nr:uncharacterized protein N7482_009495 [Penicillium canariense]KAJ5153017.1 hypothetical protein N7482_009495 [Penicillium canariense]
MRQMRPVTGPDRVLRVRDCTVSGPRNWTWMPCCGAKIAYSRLGRHYTRTHAPFSLRRKIPIPVPISPAVDVLLANLLRLANLFLTTLCPPHLQGITVGHFWTPPASAPGGWLLRDGDISHRPSGWSRARLWYVDDNGFNPASPQRTPSLQL